MFLNDINKDVMDMIANKSQKIKPDTSKRLNTQKEKF